MANVLTSIKSLKRITSSHMRRCWSNHYGRRDYKQIHHIEGEEHMNGTSSRRNSSHMGGSRSNHYGRRDYKLIHHIEGEEHMNGASSRRNSAH